MTSCYAGANQRGQKGEQNRAEKEQIQRQRKESKGTSEVRSQRHCVGSTIKAAPTVSTGPASENVATTTTHTQAVPAQRPTAGGQLLVRENVVYLKINNVTKQTKKTLLQHFHIRILNFRV